MGQYIDDHRSFTVILLLPSLLLKFASSQFRMESKAPVTRTPLPRLQLFIVCLIQIAEPITATVIYPFAPEFVRRTGITGGDETKTGYYAGMIESVFFLAECISVYQWGRAADRFGRRPISLLGPLGLSLSMVGFGLSNHFWWLVVFRCLQGVFNGNIGVGKTIMGELTDSTNIGDAFAILPLVWGLGCAAGPILGGILANPAERWPAFRRIPLFQEYPYLLACVASGAFAFTVFLITLIWLKETLPSAVARSNSISSNTTPLLQDECADYPDYGATHDAPNEATIPVLPPPSRSPTLRDVVNRKLLIVVANYCFLSFTTTSFEVLQPLMYSTSVRVGGLGLSPYQIGWIMFTWGTINAILQVFLTSLLIRKVGARNAFITSALFILLSFCAFSCESFLARQSGYIDARVVACMVVQFTCSLMLYTSYGAASVLIVQSAGSGETLGATNGFAQMCSSGVRGLAPWVASSLFSLTLQRDLAHGFGVYVVYGLLMAVSVWTSFYMVDGKLRSL